MDKLNIQKDQIDNPQENDIFEQQHEDQIVKGKNNCDLSTKDSLIASLNSSDKSISNQDNLSHTNTSDSKITTRQNRLDSVSLTEFKGVLNNLLSEVIPKSPRYKKAHEKSEAESITQENKNNTSDEGVPAMMQQVSSFAPEYKKSAVTSLINALNQDKNHELRCLDLVLFDLDATDARLIADLLIFDNVIESANLMWNNISDTGCLSLGLSLQKNQHLIKLDLQHNQIGDLGAAALAQGLKYNNNLKILSLFNNNIASLGTQALSRALTNNNSLKELNLRCNHLSDNSVSSLIETLQPNHTLKKIDIRFNRQTPEGIIQTKFALSQLNEFQRDRIIFSENKKGHSQSRLLHQVSELKVRNKPILNENNVTSPIKYTQLILLFIIILFLILLTISWYTLPFHSKQTYKCNDPYIKYFNMDVDMICMILFLISIVFVPRIL